ncbi:hypothetical protein RJ640_014725 [Escallonia rubra]|uniref:MPN domain-containing protein n=1 Tax=Escallonia rubra TaxID=112253 RepID=A0AA88RIE5_9ASTE|nr:hypothetical protein RJ640_014725 [Escallonia rubra]
MAARTEGLDFKGAKVLVDEAEDRPLRGVTGCRRRHCVVLGLMVFELAINKADATSTGTPKSGHSPRKMRPPGKSINVNAMTRKIDVDNRIPLRNYYRIADNLLKQKLPAVVDELESLKPEFQRQLDKLNKRHAGSQQDQLNDLRKDPYGSESSSSQWPVLSNNKQLQSASRVPLSSWKQNVDSTQVSPSNSIDMQFQKLSLNLPLPNKETLSRHSFLGPNGLRSQWQGPSTDIKVCYPTSTDLVPDESSSLNSAGQDDIVAVKDYHSGVDGSTMESVLSLDDGRWLRPDEELGPLYNNEVSIIRQPSPPPVLAQVQPEFLPISPSRVADPRPGPAKSFQDGTPNSNSYQHLHIKNRVFHITTLIVPKQESTSDSCQTLNEEEIFEVQDKFSLFQLGWIHTHPSQTCFMSSVDLHTHYSYQIRHFSNFLSASSQIMLPEAIAIVMAPKDESSPHGIFHLSDPGGVTVIRNCQQRGFHPHEEAEDGSPIYEHCSHVVVTVVGGRLGGGEVEPWPWELTAEGAERGRVADGEAEARLQGTYQMNKEQREEAFLG